uniref:T cell-interacting, activating receptor on myeloid cells 1 n=1 Tax=Rhinolophus ferrumequinum TaxID=59479 RepID=A0A671EJB2_RHIFE
LCVGQGDIRNESLPRPSISAWPSSVVPANSQVALRCSAPTKDGNFVLRKNGRPVRSMPSPDSPGGLAEFHLADLKTSNAEEYACEYYRRGSPHIRSPPSDVLLLLVTGDFQKPSIQAHKRGKVTAGEKVTLKCQAPEYLTGSITFALLKKGTSTPIQLQSPAGKETDFSLHNVTVGDTGNYSCVYFQTRAPFWASEPSDHLAIWVTVSPGTTSRDVTNSNLIQLAIIMVTLGAFLAEAWLSQKESPHG